MRDQLFLNLPSSSSPSLQLFHSVLDGYSSVSSACLSLLGASGRALLSWHPSWTTAGPSSTVSSLVYHTSFAILRLALLWLVTSVLLRNYRRARAELYRPAVDLQDYEMVELFLRRLKMWMGLSRAKEVHFLLHIYSCCLCFGEETHKFDLFSQRFYTDSDRRWLIMGYTAGTIHILFLILSPSLLSSLFPP